MITITIGGQQFEIGPDSMHVENEEVFEMVKNSSRVFNPYSTRKLEPYHLHTLQHSLKSIKNFAFCLGDNVQWRTDVHVHDDYVLYQRKIYTLKHPKVQFQSDLPPRYHGNKFITFYVLKYWYLLDDVLVTKSYISNIHIVVYAKMIGTRRSRVPQYNVTNNKRYEVSRKSNMIYDVHDELYDIECSDGLTKLLTI